MTRTSRRQANKPSSRQMVTPATSKALRIGMRVPRDAVGLLGPQTTGDIPCHRNQERQEATRASVLTKQISLSSGGKIKETAGRVINAYHLFLGQRRKVDDFCRGLGMGLGAGMWE